jgi:hypothetical protein
MTFDGIIVAEANDMHALSKREAISFAYMVRIANRTMRSLSFWRSENLRHKFRGGIWNSNNGACVHNLPRDLGRRD